MDYKNFALKYVGTLERTKQHKEIINYYNAHVNGYNLTYKDPWCAAFVSFVWLNCNAKNPPLECSCTRMYKLASSNKQFHKSNPKVNDAILYDWGNDGSINHVGIVSAMSKSKLSVIEGNYRDAVRIREIATTNKQIFGYITVLQNIDIIATESTIIPDTLVQEIIKGKYGNGNVRRDVITKMGYDYKAVQSAVNAKLKNKSQTL